MGHTEAAPPTPGVVAAELQQRVEDEAGAHAVAHEDDRPVAVAARHEAGRQQPPGLLRAVQRHRPCVVYHLRAMMVLIILKKYHYY